VGRKHTFYESCCALREAWHGLVVACARACGLFWLVKKLNQRLPQPPITITISEQELFDQLPMGTASKIMEILRAKGAPTNHDDYDFQVNRLVYVIKKRKKEVHHELKKPS